MAVIRELAKTKTILLISHRLANVVESDRIYMLENGRVIQSGTHRELMAEEGAYKKLYCYQRDLEAYGGAQKNGDREESGRASESREESSRENRIEHKKENGKEVAL